jgi:hypothetical protein
MSVEQNAKYQSKVESGEIDLSEDLKERNKNTKNDATTKLAKKYSMSVRGVNLRLSQNRKQPVDTLETQIDNEKKIEELNEHIQVVEELYKELLEEHDVLKESAGGDSTNIDIQALSKQLGKTPEEVADFLVTPTIDYTTLESTVDYSNLPNTDKNWVGNNEEVKGVVDIQNNTQLVKQPELEEG